MSKIALITGITGQDGAFLAEHLLAQGYIVHGIKRRASQFNTQRIDHLYLDPRENKSNLFLHYGDVSDSSNLIRIIQDTQPDEIYNLAAMSHVHVSFEIPEYTANTVAMGTLRILEAVRLLNLINKTKIYQACSSEVFGKVLETPQNELTPFNPRSPYAISKQFAYWMTVNYREAYGLFASNGILFNHESPVRGETFVTRKITRAAARIALNLQHHLFLGNLDAARDWGHAKDYVKAMHLMLQHHQPDDFVIATGKTTTVRDFASMAFREIGVEVVFVDQGIKERGVIEKINRDKFYDATQHEPEHLSIGQEIIAVDPEYFRPTEVDLLLGDARKAKEILGWEPTCTLSELIKDMMENDINLFRQERHLKDHGFLLLQEHEH